MFNELKKNIQDLHLENFYEKYEDFVEEHDGDFKTLYMMNNAPGYALAQYNDKDGYSSETWIICAPLDGRMCIMDVGNEEEMCEQFFNLMQMITLGFGTVKTRNKKENKSNEIVLE